MDRVKTENILYAAIFLAGVIYFCICMLALSGCSSAPKIVKEETEVTKKDTTVFVDVPAIQGSIFVMLTDSASDIYEGAQLNGNDTTATIKFNYKTKKIDYKIKPAKVPVTYTKETNIKKTTQVAPEKNKQQKSWLEGLGEITLGILASVVIYILIKKLKWI